MSAPCFQIKMAGRLILVEPLTPNLERFCKDYLVLGSEGSKTEADFSVSISEEDLIREGKISHEKRPMDISDSELETLALERKIAENLLHFDTILFHASCLAVDGRGICFAAPSGVGKSTQAALWRQYIGGRVIMINDDKPFLQIKEKEVTAYGSPWDGVHHMSTNADVPLEAVFLLHRNDENVILPVTAEEAYPFLLGQTYRPRDKDALCKVLPLVDRLGRLVKLFSFGCNQDPEAARIVYDQIFA